MNIYYDENMPFAKEFFSEFGNLFSFSGRELTAEKIADADILLVRSITPVNQALLSKNNRLKFVGTATIGTDHIDQLFLSKNNIPFFNAPGCNATSVAEYVISAMAVLSDHYKLNLSKLTVGIIGAGNTGSRLADKLDALGICYKLNDPLLAQKKRSSCHKSREFVSLKEALDCDIISLHVPKVTTGKYSTQHLINKAVLANMREDQILISACRGDVIDNQALLQLKQNGHKLKVVLDVWEGEPKVLVPLIEHVNIATAHIAGYSLEGKARGTEMLYQALCDQLSVTASLKLESFLPKTDILPIKIKGKLNQVKINSLIKKVYDVRRDDAIFRQQLSNQGFDVIRKNYPVRREFSSVTVKVSAQAHSDMPYRLGFSIN